MELLTGTQGQTRSEDKSCDLQETEAYSSDGWTGTGAGCGVQSGAAHQVTVQDREGSPSVHFGVPDSLSVTLDHGVGIRKQLGWRKVRGTALSGVWVLKVSLGKKAVHRSWPLKCELYTEGHEQHGLGHAKAHF